MKKVILLLFFSFQIFRGSSQAPQKALSDVASGLRKYQNITAILGAFPAEVALIKESITGKQEHVFEGIHFTEGILNGRHVVLAQTGIGKVNAAITTTLILEHFEPAQVLFTGIAGGIDPQLKPGDIVIGDKIAYHDYGTLTPDSMLRRSTLNPVTMMPNPIAFACNTALVKLAQNVSAGLVLDKVGGRSPQIITGTIVTGDVFVASNTATQQLWLKMHAEATEMEGASVSQACWQQQVPFLVIRSLSDNASNSASADVATFYKTAAHNSATLVMAIVKEIK